MATTVKDKTVIDIVPTMSGGDFKKVYDHGIIKFNQIVLGIFNQLNMPSGTLDDFPDAGVYESLLSLYFNESYFKTLRDVRDNFIKFQNQEINVDIIMDPNDGETAQLIVTVNNVPNFKFTADLQNKNQAIQVLNPQVIQV